MPAVEAKEEKCDSREVPPALLPSLLKDYSGAAIRPAPNRSAGAGQTWGKCGFQATLPNEA